MRKLHAENRGLQRIEPEIRADQIVMIFHLSAMLPDRAQLASECTVGCGDEARVAERAEILRRKKREAADCTDAAGGPAAIARPDRLGRVFDDGHSGAL